MSSLLEKIVSDSGAVGAAAATIEPVEQRVSDEYNRWLADKNHGEMRYLENHLHLRFDPSGLIEPAARTIISLAFSSNIGVRRSDKLPQFASYALGEDYHIVIRNRLENALRKLEMPSDAVWRICVDSAPVMERYWAVRSGLAYRCLNSMVAVEGYGQEILLAEILTDLPINELIGEEGKRVVIVSEPEIHTETSVSDLAAIRCVECQACVTACPGKAITESGLLTARRCVNYLTIEHRGEWNEEGRDVMRNLPEPGSIYGCNICRDVCPMNQNIPLTEIEEFTPQPALLNLTADDILRMGSGEFKRMFAKSAAKRTGLASMKRNVSK